MQPSPPLHQPAPIDPEDDMPSGIMHLPPGAQPWALGMHRAVREIRSDVRSAKTVLKLLPIVSGAVVAIVEVVIRGGGWIITHVKW
jgi:hypothetical protein